MIALLLAALVAQDAPPTPAALRRADSLVRAHPLDARAHLLLGRLHYARPVVGRYRALEAFRTAARLAPTDPEPLYWQMKVGFYLRGDDGEIIAREALLQLFALTPDYKDAWPRFQGIYRNPDVWRRAERALARHGDHPVALARRAEMLLALRDEAAADSLLGLLVASRGASARTALLRARAAFLEGRIADGYAWHDSAIALAGGDSSEALWEDAWPVASPQETRAYQNTLVDDRPAFFARFWRSRDPNLLTPENERVREHAERLAESQRHYRLLHPQRTIYHSAKARALGVFGERRELTDLAWHPNTVHDTAAPRAFRAGLTAQGLLYLRHGPPDVRAACIPDLRSPVEVHDTCYSALDYEGWLYRGPGGSFSVSFRYGGEFFWPVSREQARDIGVLLDSDRSALPAPLPVRAWTAFFRSSQLGLTDVYVKAAGDTVAAVMWGVHDGLPAVPIGPALVAFVVPPGRYGFNLDVDSAGVLGSIRRDIGVPWFAARGARLAISSLLLGTPQPDAPLLDREDALRAMPADFVFTAGTPLATYFEIYGLATDPEGRSQYRVRYTFEPVRSLPARLLAATGAAPSRVVLEFDRAGLGSDAVERLVIDPDRLPAGRYRVAVAVTDVTRNVKSESATIDIRLR